MTQEHDEPLIRLAHISSGEAPTVEVLNVSTVGNARLGEVGRGERCAQLPDEERDALQSAIEDLSVVGLEWSSEVSLHREEVDIFLAGREVRLKLHDLPNDLLPLIRLLDTSFSELFGRHYTRFLQTDDSRVIEAH